MADTRIPYRIRIGVTGHRRLDDPNAISERVRDALETGVYRLFDKPLDPRTIITPFAFTAITPLAEGADRIVAREVLRTRDAEIEVILPLALDDYLRDFVSPESKREFEGLYSRARDPVFLRKRPLSESAPAADLEEERKEAYEEVGHRVVDRCDALIAVWDGSEARGRGGTAEIISYARRIRKPVIIVSTRKKDGLSIEAGDGLSRTTFDRIESFNRFPFPIEAQQEAIAKEFADLFANPEAEKLSPALKALVRDRLLPWYVRASQIAKKSKKAYLWAGLLVYCSAPLAVAAVALGILVPKLSFLAFLLEFTLLAGIFMIISLADRRKVHKRWVETRFLAERLRSTAFLAVCRLKPVALELSPSALSALRADEWIVRAFDEIVARMGEVASMPADPFGDCASYVRRHWLEGQIAFHADCAKSSGLRSRVFEKAGRIIFLTALAAATVHLGLYGFGHPTILSWLEIPTIFLALVLPAVGAAIGGIRTHREYSRLEKRSEYMGYVLAELDRRYTSIADASELAALVLETEDYMLQDTRDWLMLMKFVRVDPL